MVCCVLVEVCGKETTGHTDIYIPYIPPLNYMMATNSYKHINYEHEIARVHNIITIISTIQNIL